MGDVNGLKLINDTFGHKEGDRLIRTVGYILESVTSKDDIVARWGGDEFVILVIDKKCLYSSQIIQNAKCKCKKIASFSFKVGIGLGSAEKVKEIAGRQCWAWQRRECTKIRLQK